MAANQPHKVVFSKAPVAGDPIPEADIIRGHPKAQTYVLHESDGGAYVCGVWHCTPGTYHWNSANDEFVYFVEGEARLRWDDGRTITVRKGEAAHFPKGHCVWTISKTVKKVFVLRS
jgi:uncharacterized cupin superfamily protein